MANIAIKRVQREFKEVVRSEELKCKVELVDNSYTRLRGEIAGPPGTPFEGGIYKLDINIPETYPFNPPKVQFVTKIWHPNISSVTGVICLDILKDQWAAAMTLRTVLLSIQALLSAAEPDDPQDAVVARQYKEHPEVYWRTAKHWAEEYAGDAKSSSLVNPFLEFRKSCGVFTQQLTGVLVQRSFLDVLVTADIIARKQASLDRELHIIL
ncbi:Ubiquitin-conjugating enzyme E2 K [Stylophora pistillata]|uniref:Ubiquitin-conjugating enzyme E2 K n=1 Tax=Stylophora pistillata TaxID=50429 RepID=A0A2B4T0N3_STYPI|nr:Ubiquitin-conjugating enzyme E2 K [Stylophora pistillata]